VHLGGFLILFSSHILYVVLDTSPDRPTDLVN
jgi:hypothetical protein